MDQKLDDTRQLQYTPAFHIEMVLVQPLNFNGTVEWLQWESYTQHSRIQAKNSMNNFTNCTTYSIILLLGYGLDRLTEVV